MASENIVEALPVLRKHWGESVVDSLFAAIALEPHTPMSFRKFLDSCVACGGDWGQMWLSGIKNLWPLVYEAIPDNMGLEAWENLAIVLMLCGVDLGE